MEKSGTQVSYVGLFHVAQFSFVLILGQTNIIVSYYVQDEKGRK